MAEYDDLQQIESLRVEQANIGRAIAVLDEQNGIVSHFTVTPIIEPDVMNTPMNTPMLSSVSVSTTDPQPELMDAARQGLITRYNAINAELTELGVTGLPASKT